MCRVLAFRNKSWSQKIVSFLLPIDRLCTYSDWLVAQQVFARVLSKRNGIGERVCNCLERESYFFFIHLEKIKWSYVKKKKI